MQTQPQDPKTAALICEIGQSLGLSRSAGLAYAAIWQATTPPNAEELVGLSKLSRSGVSAALKELRDWGLVSATRDATSRADRYSANQNPWANLRQVLAALSHLRLAPLANRAEGTPFAEMLRASNIALMALAALPPEHLAEALHSALPDPKKKKKKKG